MNVPKQLVWTAGDEPDADTFNLYVRDTLNFLLDTPEVYVEQTTAQSLTAGVFTAVQFNAIRKNNDNMAVLTGSPPSTTKLVCVTPGWYEFEFGGAWAANADASTNRQIVNIRKNGVGAGVGRAEVEVITSTARIIGGAFDALYLNTDDYVELVLFHTGTARTTFVTDPFTRSYLKGKWVSK